MRLAVFLEGRRVGELEHDAKTNRYKFTYGPEWVAWVDRFALAPSLPIGSTDASPEMHGTAVRQFFENLLPEGQALDDAARANKVSKANVVGLLAALGRETAGALQIHPVDRDPVAQPAGRRRLPREELSARIRERPARPFSVWDARVRLSIAGLQDKVAVYADGDDWFLVDGEPLASTHILKPEPVAEPLRGLTSNEFFCLRLARRLAVSAADVRLVHVPEPVLVVTRFDRRVHPARVERLHVIDGCQALGLPVIAKYERPYGDGRDVAGQRTGASLPALFALFRDGPRPLVNRDALLRWVIFQVMIGNADAHAKNLSFFVRPTGLELAPAYDLVSVGALTDPRLSQTYALAIGDAFTIGDLTPLEWASFAATCALPPKLVARELEQLSVRARATLADLAEEVRDEGARGEVIDRVREVVATNARVLEAMAPDVARVPKRIL